MKARASRVESEYKSEMAERRICLARISRVISSSMFFTFDLLKYRNIRFFSMFSKHFLTICWKMWLRALLLTTLLCWSCAEGNSEFTRLYFEMITLLNIILYTN